MKIGPSPDLSRLVALIKDVASRYFDVTPTTAEVELFLRSLLFEPRNYWAAVRRGLVTQQEAAVFFADHTHRWLMERTGRPWGGPQTAPWADIVRAFEEALFRPAPS
jgi:hypothetical protein